MSTKYVNLKIQFQYQYQIGASLTAFPGTSAGLERLLFSSGGLQRTYQQPEEPVEDLTTLNLEVNTRVRVGEELPTLQGNGQMSLLHPAPETLQSKNLVFHWNYKAVSQPPNLYRDW